MLQAQSILVTGSNRGIGLEIVRQLAGKSHWIFATCREPEGPRAKELKNLAAKHQGVEIIPLDTSDPSSIKTAAATVTERLQGAGLNLLINNAAIVKPSSLESETAEDMAEVYKTNVIGPMLMSQTFLPLLRKAAQESPQKGMSCSKAAIVNVSSDSGSIAGVLGWELGHVINYRCSKAALNMLSRCQGLGYAEDEILCIALHPGWVQTDMGNSAGPAPAPMALDTSVQAILNTFGQLTEKDNGTFVNWDGSVLPWGFTSQAIADKEEMLNARSVLVTGSNRGIGLEFIRQLSEKSNQPEWIFATCRDPEGPRSQELRNLAAKHKGIEIIQLDTTDPSSIQAAAARVKELLRGAGLNLLINNAGILRAGSLESETEEDMAEVYKNNVTGTLLVSQAFLTLLRKASQESLLEGMSCSKAAVVNVSSEGGSIANLLIWDVGHFISYRCSKAALNMLSRCQSLGYAEDKILCIALHPGWVQTDMGASVGQAPMTVEASVQAILNTLGRLSEKDSGTFLNWEGTSVPW